MKTVNRVFEVRIYDCVSFNYIKNINEKYDIIIKHAK